MNFFKTTFLGLFIILFNFSFSQITGNGTSTIEPTVYTDGSSQDVIYIYCVEPGTVASIGSLTANSSNGVGPWDFEWFQYNTTTNSYDSYSIDNNQISSTLTNLPSGGYSVSIVDNNGDGVGCYRAWVFNNETDLDAGSVGASCGGFNLNGTANPIADFVYYNPPSDQFIIDASTEITVCFDAVHTYISDLAFYLIAPDGTSVALSPNPGVIGQGTICNSDDDVSNLCFTTNLATNFNACTESGPYSGTFDSYGSGSGTPIDWSVIFGQDAAQGGWAIQIFDCISEDVGFLTNASLTFTGNSICGPEVINYDSGNINSAINDNSCDAVSASSYVVPANPVLTTPIVLVNTITSFEWTSDNPCVTIPNATTSLNPSIASTPTTNTWFYLTSTDNFGCTYTDSVQFIRDCPCITNSPFISLSSNVSVTDCSTTPGTFGIIDGNIQFNDGLVPCTGTLTITNCSGDNVVFNAPFISPITFSIPDIVADGTTNCILIAEFSDDPENCVIETAIFTEPNDLLDNPGFSYPETIYCISEGDPIAAIDVIGGGFTFTTISGGPTLVIDGTTGLIDLSASNEGVYDVTYTTTGLCPQDSTITMNVAGSPTVDPVMDQTVCSGVDFSLISFTGSIGASFNWVNDNTAIGLAANGIGDIIGFTGVNSTGVQISSLITVTASAGNCTGKTTIAFDLSIDPLDNPGFSYPASSYCTTEVDPISTVVSAGGFTFLATTGGPTLVIDAVTGLIDLSASDEGVYDVTYTTTGLCPQDSTVSIAINFTPTVSVISDQTICQDANFTAVTFTGASGIVATTYDWTNDNTIIGLAANGISDITTFTALNGTVSQISSTVTVTPSTLTCIGTATTFDLSVDPLPVVDFTADNLTGCAPISIEFTSLSTNGNVYEWTFGDGAVGNGIVSSYTYQNTGVYDVGLTVTSLEGCANVVDEIGYVTVLSMPIADFSFNPEITDIFHTEIEFTNASTNGDYYEWDFGDETTLSYDTDPTHYYADISGQYPITLWVYNNNGLCRDSIQKLITIDDILLYYVPNAFTPDGNTYNDIFKPVFTSGFDPYNYHLMIFNRWGEMIFESYDANFGWNGTYLNNGEVCTDGVYIWKILFKETMSDKRHNITGHVSLIK